MLEEPGGPAPLTRKQLRLRRIAAEAPVEARGPDGPPLGAPPAESWTSPSAEARRLAHYAFALDDNSYQAPAGPESYWGTAVAAAAAPAAPAPRAAATGTAAPAAGTALAASGTAVDSALATGTAVDPALAAPVQHGTPARRADAWTGREDQRPSYLSHRVAEQEQSRATAAGSPSPNAARAAVPPAGAASPAAPLAGMSSPAQAPYPVALPSVTATPVATVAAALATAAQEAALATEPRPALSAPSGAAHAHAGSAMREKAATPARARIQPGRALANAWAAMLAKASTPTRNSNARARLRPRRALANGWVAARSAPSAGELAATPGPAASGALEDATLRQDRPRVRIR
ncbi:MAG: hypothetical protein LBL01_06715, partial [Bifidobacteriaceae bacterium]|nr:hypothetical protein [Bifidobacteriaceae bacterium]